MNRIYKIIAIFGITVGLGSFAPTAVAEPPRTVPSSQVETVVSEDFVKLASQAIEHQDYHNAVVHTNKAIDLNSQSATAYLLRGQARGYMGERQAAIADLRTAARLYQDNNNRVGYILALEYLEDLTGPNSPQAFGTLPLLFE